MAAAPTQSLTLPLGSSWLPWRGVRHLGVRDGHLDLQDLGKGLLPLERIRCVEFHRKGAEGEARFQVQLSTSRETVDVLETGDRVLARAVAERLARHLDRSLRDFTGRELKLRAPSELDVPLELEGPPPGEPDPAWGLRVEADRVSWPDPSRLGSGVALFLAALSLALGSLLPALLCLGGAVGLARLRGHCSVLPERLVVGRGLPPFYPGDSLIPGTLEQVELEVHWDPRLLLISDERILRLQRPREQLEWMHLWILERLRATSSSGQPAAEDGGGTGEEAPEKD